MLREQTSGIKTTQHPLVRSSLTIAQAVTHRSVSFTTVSLNCTLDMMSMSGYRDLGYREA